MDASDAGPLLCPVCAADLTGSDRAFCSNDCRERWRQQRRTRYASPPGALAEELLRALDDELRAAGQRP